MVKEESFRRAVSQMEKGRHKDAVDTLTELLEHLPESLAALVTLGDAHWELAQHGLAVEAFRRAVHLAPKFRPASLGLFHCLWEQGLREEALEEVKRYTELTGSDEYMEIIRAINGSAK